MGQIAGASLPGLADRVLEILRCTSCNSQIREDAQGVVCVSCNKRFPRIRGVLRFVDEQAYTSSFGFQWNKHDTTQLDSGSNTRSEDDFVLKTGLHPKDLEGKLVLDVGCGMGRYAEVVTRWGALVIGIDLSQAVEAAARNMKDRQAVIIQADVFSLPFAPESFDYIYSLGVLHHTPDCEKAVKKLPPLIKPGGGMAIWLYSAYNKWYRFSDVYREITRRMSPKLLHTLCYGTVPIYGFHRVLRKVPLLGRPVSGVLRYLVPMSFNPDRKWRVLDTFDWYSPWYQSKHTYEEMFRWFESSGLEDLHVGSVPVGVRGRKPRSKPQIDRLQQGAEVAQCAG